MLTIDRRPPPPELPQFSRDMQAFLTAAADSTATRHPRRARRYAVAVTAAATVIAVIVAVAVTRGSGSNPRPTPTPGIQLASFSVSQTSGGLVKLTLTPGQLRDPDALHRALANVSVPALVTADKVCYLPGPTSLLAQILSAPARHQPDGSTVWTITPSAIPSNVELSIGYYQVSDGFGIHVTVVPEHTTLTCTSAPPSPPHR